jgi:hypothetical protein
MISLLLALIFLGLPLFSIIMSLVGLFRCVSYKKSGKKEVRKIDYIYFTTSLLTGVVALLFVVTVFFLRSCIVY